MHEHGFGRFVISLDFELHWGMFDAVSISQYGEHYRGVPRAIASLLDLFREYEIRATWATVGMLMCRDIDELQTFLPEEHERPVYTNPRLSSYRYIEESAEHIRAHPEYYFAPDLVREIQKTPGQELASHTFSHFYCLEEQEGGGKGSRASFAADCAAQNAIFERYDTTPRSLVFPRNQVNNAALTTAREHGISAYRGTEDHILYRGRTEDSQSLPIRGLRLIDAYLNVSGHHTYTHSTASRAPRTDMLTPITVPSSRFLRPWSRRLSPLEPLRLTRIKNAMTHAAKGGELFHLWWHPHNFGVNLEENMSVLTDIVEHYAALHEQYGMKSMTMHETAAASTARENT